MEEIIINSKTFPYAKLAKIETYQDKTNEISDLVNRILEQQYDNLLNWKYDELTKRIDVNEYVGALTQIQFAFLQQLTYSLADKLRDLGWNCKIILGYFSDHGGYGGEIFIKNPNNPSLFIIKELKTFFKWKL